jgi:hypothetical protein
VLEGELNDAIFAANFGQLIKSEAPVVYGRPALFFQNTHPTAALKRICTSVFSRLANTNEAGAVLRLSTGFGGGKTHTLMALWHLANNIGDTSMGADLVPPAGRPRPPSRPRTPSCPGHPHRPGDAARGATHRPGGSRPPPQRIAAAALRLPANATGCARCHHGRCAVNNTSRRPTPWLGISDSNFDVQGEYSSL